MLQFATVMMAITGEAFMDAGRRVTDLLARNLLNAFASTIWWVRRPSGARACQCLARGMMGWPRRGPALHAFLSAW